LPHPLEDFLQFSYRKMSWNWCNLSQSFPQEAGSMNTEPIANHCPKCQAPLPANAPQGLCAKCLLAAVSTPTEAGQPADRQPPPPIALVAAAFPQLEILELIGHGGMGVVYKARQPRLDRVVALKLLPQSLAADAAFAERFNREARVLARLNHPNIVTVHDFGQSGGFFYLLMEFVDGVNLRQAMQAGRFTPQQAMMLVPKICEALQFAHDEGILHRDIKPENILLDTRGRVKIADFGIAKLLGEAREKVTLTASGLAVGTPHYMAPEQLEHPQDVDQRADIYSLGVVFYEMLTGELPIGRFAPPSQKSSVDARVDDVVFHALEKEREKRFRSAGEVKTSVEAITSNPAVPPAQAAAGSAHPRPSSGAPIPERRIPCHISTPEHLSTFTGQTFHIYTGKGELRLDAENLAFVSDWQSSTIPLRDIRELGIGHYSRLAKPLRLDYLAVTFEQAGQARTLLFTPTGGSSIIQLPWAANARVAECFQAVREAVIARTGTPPTGPSTPVPPPETFASELRDALQLVLPVCVLSAVIAGLVALLRHTSNVSSRRLGQGLDAWFPSADTLISLSVPALVLGLIGWAILKRKQPRILGGTIGAPLSPSPTDTVVLPTDASPPARRATCYFSTPERMRNCFPGPAAHIFLCKGELQIEDDKLRFVSPWQTEVVIGLRDIQDLSIGQFKMWHTPWVMKYERLNFLAVTFTRNGQMRIVHLTPTAPGAASTNDINAQVAAWFKCIREAAIACTSVAPHSSEPVDVSISAQPAWNRKGVPLFAAFLAIWGVLVCRLPKLAGPSPDALTIVVFVAMLLLLVATVWYAVGFLQANSALRHGKLDAITGDDPPALEPITGTGVKMAPGKPRRPGWWTVSAWIFIAIGVIAVVDTLAALYSRPLNFTFYPGLAHLFAGIALLTLNPRWRMVALAGLWLAFLAGAFIGVMMAVAPQNGSVSLPMLDLRLKPNELPYLAAAAAVFLTVMLVWPYYLLTCEQGRGLFKYPTAATS
jgi:serine/threonine protein kinase